VLFSWSASRPTIFESVVIVVISSDMDFELDAMVVRRDITLDFWQVVIPEIP
jgi:hypothetical protein